MPLTTSAPSPALARTCAGIMELLLPHRRGMDSAAAHVEAFPEQLARISGFVRAGEPVVFALPGFPCKSPNPAKVLGHYPDQGERLSLRFLDSLCRQVEAVYEPGARLVVCSDGHVFGDLIHVPDPRIDAYGDALREMIRRDGLDRLSVIGLPDLLHGVPHDQGRTLLDSTYAPTTEDLRAEVRADAHTRALYQGITRFLVEDDAGFTGTRSALQRDCRRRAYGVIRRSRAWGTLVADHFPDAVRLSIHPQPVGAAKFGIRLLDAADAWTTPWHSAALRHPDGRWELLPRSAAERMGRLVHAGGRPSHFEMALTPRR